MKKLLVVDDEGAVLDVAETILTGAGYSVTCVESAEDALEALEKVSFSVFFLDLFLPGMNGVDLCRIIRGRFPNAFIYAITAHALRYDIADCRGTGFDDVFHKPVEGAILLEAASNAFAALDARGAAD